MSTQGLSYTIRPALLVTPSSATRDFLRDARQTECHRARRAQESRRPPIGIAIALALGLAIWTAPITMALYLM